MARHPALRLLLFVAAVLLCMGVGQLAVEPLLVGLGAFLGVRLVVFAWVSALALVVAHELAFRWGRHGSWAWVGLGGAAARPRLLVKGTLLGTLAIGVPSLVLMGVEWLEVAPAPEGSSLAAGLHLLALLAPAAFFEELLLRGYAFATLREWLGAAPALLLTSVVFGFLHVWNPGAKLQSVVQVVFAGVWLGGVLLATGSLWAAWLAHLAWNWTMAALLHAPVSGLSLAAPDYRLVDAGPDWATGGAWGPEAGLGATLGMAASLVFLYVRHLRRGESEG